MSAGLRTDCRNGSPTGRADCRIAGSGAVVPLSQFSHRAVIHKRFRAIIETAHRRTVVGGRCRGRNRWPGKIFFDGSRSHSEPILKGFTYRYFLKVPAPPPGAKRPVRVKPHFARFRGCQGHSERPNMAGLKATRERGPPLKAARKFSWGMKICGRSRRLLRIANIRITVSTHLVFMHCK